MIIAERHLKEVHACYSSITTFRSLFPARKYPRGVRVTVERCIAHAKDFDWHYAVRFLVPGDPYINSRAFLNLTRVASRHLEQLRNIHNGFNCVFNDDGCDQCRNIGQAYDDFCAAEARAFALLVRNPSLRKG